MEFFLPALVVAGILLFWFLSMGWTPLLACGHCILWPIAFLAGPWLGLADDLPKFAFFGALCGSIMALLAYRYRALFDRPQCAPSSHPLDYVLCVFIFAAFFLGLAPSYLQGDFKDVTKLDTAFITIERNIERRAYPQLDVALLESSGSSSNALHRLFGDTANARGEVTIEFLRVSELLSEANENAGETLDVRPTIYQNFVIGRLLAPFAHCFSFGPNEAPGFGAARLVLVRYVMRIESAMRQLGELETEPEPDEEEIYRIHDWLLQERDAAIRSMAFELLGGPGDCLESVSTTNGPVAPSWPRFGPRMDDDAVKPALWAMVATIYANNGNPLAASEALGQVEGELNTPLLASAAYAVGVASSHPRALLLEDSRRLFLLLNKRCEEFDCLDLALDPTSQAKVSEKRAFLRQTYLGRLLSAANNYVDDLNHALMAGDLEAEAMARLAKAPVEPLQNAADMPEAFTPFIENLARGIYLETLSTHKLALAWGRGSVTRHHLSKSLKLLRRSELALIRHHDETGGTSSSRRTLRLVRSQLASLRGLHQEL